MMIKKDTVIIINLLGILGCSIISSMALYIQFVYHELPCQLCQLQRLGLLAIVYGYILNVLYMPKPFHYAISTLAAIFTSFISLRQIVLHIVPNSGEYGSSILGFHLYTWLFIVCTAIIIWDMFILSICEFDRTTGYKYSRVQRIIINSCIGFYLLILVINIVNIFFECGFSQCPENPTNYFIHLFK